MVQPIENLTSYSLSNTLQDCNYDNHKLPNLAVQFNVKLLKKIDFWVTIDHPPPHQDLSYLKKHS